MILCGASNLVLGWKPAVRALFSLVVGPMDLYVACGMGRSYVGTSRFGARQLPGIIESGLWEALAGRDSLNAAERSPLILLTDIGNDLVYRRDPGVIVDTVAQCVRRFREWRADCRFLMTGLPLDSLSHLSQFRFVIARSLLFPGADVQLPRIRSEALDLNEQVRNLATQSQVGFVEPSRDWYGFDPIHIRRPLRDQAFRTIFSHWNLATAAPGVDPENLRSNAPAHEHPLDRLTIPPLPPAAERIVFGRTRYTSQPCFVSDSLHVFSY